MTDNYFALLTLDEALLLDDAGLKKAYFKAQQSYHPDRAMNDVQRMQFLQRSADINCAYQTLKSFDTRLNYILKIHGTDIEGKSPPATPPALLMQSMQWREDWMECTTEEARIAFRAALQQQIDAQQEQALRAYEHTNIAGMVEAALYLRYLSRMKQEIERN